MTSRKVEIGPHVLYCGDCLDVLPSLRKVDACVTDPPYIIGAISTGDDSSKSGTWADMQNAAYWFSAWYDACRSILKPTGFMAACCNWRSIPTVICALSRISWRASSCLVWDKQWIGPAGPTQLRPTYEMVTISPMPDAKIVNRSASDIYRGEQWLAGNCKTTSHAAEKPVGLMQHLIELLTPFDGLVVDPFMGSGTTAVACILKGRRFIGIENDERHFETACRRIRDAYESEPLLEGLDEPTFTTQPMFTEAVA